MEMADVRHAFGILLFAVLLPATAAFSQTTSTAGDNGAEAERPNIVLMFPDNLGWGEVGSFGSVRGVPTPQIDKIADEGIRLKNFNVEYSCTVSRIALLTGRYAVRAGGTQATGMTLWEVTMAEALREQGYATGLFGKWHVGGDDWQGQREPQDQGFDEWYGIPGTSHTAQYRLFDSWNPATMEEPYIWEGKTGERSRKVKPYDMESRRTVDREAAERGIAFMERNVREGRPFFFYYPMTQIHFPTLAHPDYAGTTGAGDIGDAMADVDHNVGLVLAAIDRLGIADNTIVFWCPDNGAELRRPWRGSAGPWRGFYNTAMEGGIRTPCVIRWPARIPAGQVSNEIVHEIDFFPTLAAAAGAPEMVPTDRPVDGVNQLPFLEGKQAQSNRQSVIYRSQDGHLLAVKWRDWKLWYDFKPDPIGPNPDPKVRLFNLRYDPKEETDIKDFHPGVLTVMDSILADFRTSVESFPNVPVTAKDPYVPPPDRGEATRKTTPEAGSDTIPASGRQRPDFGGKWTRKAARDETPSAESGWGPAFTIVQRPSEISVERTLFSLVDMQPPLKFTYALDGSESKNTHLLGRGVQEQVSTATWQGNQLVISTIYSDSGAADRREGMTSKVTHTLSFQWPRRKAHPPNLVIETTRHAVAGGVPSTTRTVYIKG